MRPCVPLCAACRSVEFAVDTPTVAAGSLGGGRRLVQAFPQGVRLLGELACGAQPPAGGAAACCALAWGV